MTAVKNLLYLILLACTSQVVASTVSIYGVTVDEGGSTDQVGINTGDKIKYYIPLGYSAVYGVNPSPCTHGAGTCRDIGGGVGYSDASALDMNIYFDLTNHAKITDAELKFQFDDLDLQGINDPWKFYESMTFSYWDGANYNQLNQTIFSTEDMVDPIFTGGVVNNATKNTPLLWTLDLAALDILDDLNHTQAGDDSGFWVQLGFGSDYKNSARNTPEYVTASLNISPVPLPSAAWLFGTALLGFIGFSTKTKI